jgi:signal transduction protein with GAF and PtsI domain
MSAHNELPARGSGPSVEERLERKTGELRALATIGAALASTRALQGTLDIITSVTTELMRVASCSVYLHDDATGRLVLKATSGLAQEAVGIASLGAGEGLTGWTVTHGKPVAAADAVADPRFKLVPEAEEMSLRSLLAVPLTVEGRTIGAMNVQTREVHDFQDEEVELLSLVANLAAGALEKAALLDRLQRHVAELEAVASRRVLDRAKGLLMQRDGGSEREAAGVLEDRARNERRTLLEAAEEIIAELDRP